MEGGILETYEIRGFRAQVEEEAEEEEATKSGNEASEGPALCAAWASCCRRLLAIAHIMWSHIPALAIYFRYTSSNDKCD